MTEINNPEITERKYRISPVSGVILGILAVLFAAILPGETGGIPAIIPAVACESLLLLAEPSFAAYIPIPLSYIAAVIFTGDPIISLTCLLAVPCSFCIRICFPKKYSLSQTLVALTVVFAVCIGVKTAFDLQIGFGSVAAGIGAVKAQMSAYMDKVFDMMKKMIEEQGLDEEFFEMTDEGIRLLKKQLLMICPALFILGCEGAAYISEKLMKLLSRIFRVSFVAQRKDKVTVSTPSAVIFLASYAISSFSIGDNAVYYIAENLMIMVLPFAAVAGIHSMFGKDSIFMKTGRTFLKITTVILCVMAFTASPVMLFLLFALWGSTATVAKAVISRIINSTGSNGER